MTDLNNSNDGEETKPHDSGRNGGDSSEISEEAAWNRFLDEYSDDLGEVERSRTARKFDRHATRQDKREEKRAILSVNDLKQGSFVDSSGPRDFTQSSWLDTDDVMDRSSVFLPQSRSGSDSLVASHLRHSARRRRRRHHRHGVSASLGDRARHRLRHLDTRRRRWPVRHTPRS